jgi:hypothetical protein
VLGGPADLLDGALDVVQHDLADPGPAARGVGAEVGQPPVVGPQAGPAALEVPGPGARRLVDQRHLREERRHGVGEQHLGDDAVGLQLRQPATESQLRLPSAPATSSKGFS